MSPTYRHRPPPATVQEPPPSLPPAQPAAVQPQSPPSLPPQPQPPAQEQEPKPDAAAPPTPAHRPKPERPARRVAHRAPRPRGPPWTRLEAVALAGIVALALAFRLREVLASPIMGAEDPYRHMERTYDLVQGLGLGNYPPGITVLLAPLTLLGPAGFYQATRALPVLTGVSLVLGVHGLCRRFVHPGGALAGALFAALMPETIRRTDLMFPTAIDLALLPWALLLVLLASQGWRAAWGWGVAFLAFALATHPWLVGLLGPPVGAFAFVLAVRTPGRRRALALAVAGATLVAVLAASRLGNLGGGILSHAFAHLRSLAAHPSSLVPLPQLVDFPAMLTVPALVVGAAGAVVAVLRPTRFGLLALLVTVLLLPVILVDWFDVWYIPHRTVVYFAVGLCMLIAIAVGELVHLVAQASPASLPLATAGVLAVLLLVSVQPALAMPTWYRIFGPDDFAAWQALDARGTPYVEAGSWQARMGYRSTTGGPAVYNPPFFADKGVRDYELKQHPGLVVLIDQAARDAGTPTSFLSSWTVVGQWGNVTAYSAPPP